MPVITDKYDKEETLKYYRSKKTDSEREFQVELGDSKDSAEHFPQIKMMWWNNECNLSIRLITDEKVSVTEDDKENKLKYSAGNIEIEYYDLDGFDEDSSFEKMLILKSKPKTNEIDFTIRSKGLNAYYQDWLTDEEKEAGDIRPEEIIESYALYFSGKHNKYKTGKAAHIKRIKCIDYDGMTVFAGQQLDLEKQTYKIIIPQWFLNSASYPVKVDPTFGNTSIGGSSSGCYSNGYATGATLSEAGDVSKITAYIEGNNSSDAKLGIYDDDTDDPGNLEGMANVISAVSSTAGWRDATYSSALSLTAAQYHIAIYGESSSIKYYYDSGVQNSYSNGGSYASPDDPWSGTSSHSRIRSFYATYTTGGGSDISEVGKVTWANVGEVCGVAKASVGEVGKVSA